MPDYYELKKMAEKFAKKERNWRRAFEIYKIIFENYSRNVNLWDKYWYASSAFHINELNIAQNISLELHKFMPEFELNNRLLAQIIIAKINRKIKAYPPERIVQQYKAISQIKLRNDDAAKIVLDFAKILRQKGEHKKALEILTDFDIAKLSTDKKKTAEGKIIPSVAESFYLIFIKLLVINKLYEEVIKMTDFVIKNLDITPNNKKWFLKYKAEAFYELKKYSEALDIYLNINKHKPLWFIDFQIAKILYADKEDIALAYACRAALDRKQETWFKIKVFKFFLEKFADKFSEDQLIILAKMIAGNYLKHGYPDNKIILQIKNRLGINFEDGFDLKSLEKQTYQTIKKIYYGDLLKGKIIKVLKGFGYIKMQQKNIFFHFNDILFDKKLLEPGLKVKFHIIWDYNYTKKQFAQKAVKIKIINEK